MKCNMNCMQIVKRKGEIIMPTTEEVSQKLAQDKIRFVLTQFVDIHGSAKVKMSPAEALPGLVEEGAGLPEPPSGAWARVPTPTT
jgi:glutamine synthetase